MRKMLTAALALLGFATAPARADYVLNGQGANGYYQVYRVTDDGALTNPTVIVSPSGSGFDATNIYWPSAVNVGGAIYVYATGQDASGNQSIGLWTSANGINFTRVGQVLAPIVGETQIGAAHVIYDPSDSAAPFKMWFGTNTNAYGRPSEIKYATSANGVNWTRQATVLTASQSYETQGFQLDYVCRDSGAWRMFYSATSDPANSFQAVEANSPTPGGAFIKRGVVFAPGGSTHTVLSTVVPGNRYLRLNSTAGLQAGGVYVLSNGLVSERVVIERVIDGDEASIEDAMVSSGSGFQLRSTDYRKVGISVFYRDAGLGRFLATGWGAFATSPLHEYVIEGSESGGTFVRDYSAPNRFRPPGPGSLYSFENPSPITTGPDC